MRKLGFSLAILLSCQSAFAQPPQPRQRPDSDSSNRTHPSNERNTWSAWRGDDGTNVLHQGSLPTTWSASANIAWRSDVPGYGWSSPIVIGEQVVVTTAIADDLPAPVLFGPGSGHYDPPDKTVQFCVLCYELSTGKLRWQMTLAEKKPEFAIHPTNTYATETPVSDGQSIYVRFGEIGLFCLDLNGHVKWRHDIGPYRMQGGWGTSSNPLLTDRGVIVQVDSETASFVMLLSKEDGQPIWRVDRRERSAWSTPFLWRNHQRDEVILIGAKSIRSYDPDDGKELWSLGATGRSSGGRPNDPAFEAGSCKASPTGNKDLLLVGKGNRAKAGASQFGPFWAVKPGGSGDINVPADGSPDDEHAFVKWYREDAGPVIASPLIVDDLIYIAPRNGSKINCLDLDDGKTVYTQALGREQYFFITPWATKDHIYATSGSGKTFVFKTGREFELVATNDLAEHTYAAPALLNGSLIFRTEQHLYCIGKPPAFEAVAKSESPSPRPDRTAPNPPPRGGRQSSSRVIEFSLAIDNLTAEQRQSIEKLIATSKQREQELAAGSDVPRASERLRDDLRRGIEAVLDDTQKKALRTRLAEGSGDPGAANGGPITTLREQLAQIGLTKEQDFAVQSLVLQLRDDIGKATRDSTQNRGTAIRNITEEYKRKIIALLTDEQREKLNSFKRR